MLLSEGTGWCRAHGTYAVGYTDTVSTLCPSLYPTWPPCFPCANSTWYGRRSWWAAWPQTSLILSGPPTIGAWATSSRVLSNSRSRPLFLRSGFFILPSSDPPQRCCPSACSRDCAANSESSHSVGLPVLRLSCFLWHWALPRTWSG